IMAAKGPATGQRKTEHVLAQMRRGATLHRTNGSNSTRWALSTGRAVSNEVARAVISCSDVVGVGDALFDRGLSQTWRWVGLSRITSAKETTHEQAKTAD